MIFPEVVAAENARRLGIPEHEYWNQTRRELRRNILRGLSDQQISEYLSALETVARYSSTKRGLETCWFYDIPKELRAELEQRRSSQ